MHSAPAEFSSELQESVADFAVVGGDGSKDEVSARTRLVREIASSEKT
jgi:hypothetical protein